MDFPSSSTKRRLDRGRVGSSGSRRVAGSTNSDPGCPGDQSGATNVVSYDRFLEALAGHHQHAEAQAHDVEFVLWRVVKNDLMAMARTRRHPGGLELCILLGADLVWSRVYPPGAQSLLDADLEIKRSQFIGAEWTVVGA